MIIFRTLPLKTDADVEKGNDWPYAAQASHN